MIDSFTFLGATIQFYDLFFVLGFVGVFIYLLHICKNYKISKGKTIIFTILVYTSSLIWMYFLYWADSGFTKWGGNNIVRVFWWLGVFTYPVAKMLKINYLKALDYVSPCLCINHGIAHIGCIFAGCCHGYQCDWGLFSNHAGFNTFPTQPIESLVAFIIAILIALREKKKGYGKGVDGLSFPIMLMLFGYSRFLLEFLRDNEKLFYITKSVTWAGKPVFGISQLAIHALINAAVGTVAYFIIKKKYSTKDL